MSENIYIAFPRDLYNDLIRLSADGFPEPEALAVDLIERWICDSLESDPEERWGDNYMEVAEKYAPDLYNKWLDEDNDSVKARQADALPLIWKEVTISSGSEVRMAYGDGHHLAKVKGGKIVDDDGTFSPSEWASKVAGGTSRNAWRDLWFKEPYGKAWVPAQLLRDQALAAQAKEAPDAQA